MKEILCKGVSVTMILVFGILFASDAFSETNEDGKVDMIEMETITVTAQKREEDVQKVTTSISVLSDIAIEDAGIESTEDIWRYIPNFSIFHGGSRDFYTIINLRGISNTAFGDPAVALYIDDVSYADVYAFNSALFDIERIEVLKGPQGTLYGKNTSGGAINIVTKSPGDAFEARVGVEAGNFDKREVNGVINAPLFEDKLFFRLAGLYSTRDGYIKNLFNNEYIDNQETTAANVRLLFIPIDNLSFNLTFRIHEFNDGGGPIMVPVDKSRYQAVTGLTDLDDFEVSYNYVGESSSRSNATSLRIKYERDNFDLVSVTSYRDMDNENSVDGDATPSELYAGFNAAGSESITQELRLQSRGSDESFKWLVGLYYSDEDKDHGYEYMADKVYADMKGVPLYTVMDDVSAFIGAEDMAVFGQSTVRFFNDALGLTAGLRYERSKRTMDRQHTALGSIPVVMNDLEKTYTEFLPKLAMDYRFNDDIMAYASAARGYKAGGFAYAVDDPALAGFDPEISTAFELGLKTGFPELGLRFNVAGFYTKVDDYQDRVQLDAITVIQANAAETDIYGFELEASMPLSETLSLNGFLGYTNAEYGEYIEPMTGVNYKGNRVANIPEYDFGVFLEYRDRFGIFARVEMQGFGGSYFDRANTEEQSSYTLFNMKVGYEQDNWDMYLFAQNVTDEQYFVQAWEHPAFGYMSTVGTPRTVSMSFNYRF